MIRAAALLGCFAAGLWAQYPPGTEWRRIRTAHFDIVFPSEIEADAQRAANALETMYAPLSRSLGAALPSHTTVVLANQNVTRYSGGSVSLFPRMATFEMMPEQTFWGTNHLAADGRFALPGLAPHHALVLESGYERNDGNYYFFREIQFPRGYTYYTGANLTKLSGTYSVPLLYPDWSIGQVLYIKRVAADGFYDYGKVGETLYRSTGAEVVFDVNLFHWPGIRIGLREAYRLDFGNTRLNPFLAFGW